MEFGAERMRVPVKKTYTMVTSWYPDSTWLNDNSIAAGSGSNGRFEWLGTTSCESYAGNDVQVAAIFGAAV